MKITNAKLLSQRPPYPIFPPRFYLSVVWSHAPSRRPQQYPPPWPFPPPPQPPDPGHPLYVASSSSHSQSAHKFHPGIRFSHRPSSLSPHRRIYQQSVPSPAFSLYPVLQCNQKQVLSYFSSHALD